MGAPFSIGPLADTAAATDPERLAAAPACQLFIERARAVTPQFGVSVATAPIVTEICARLDGLPLAIELAAARSSVLAPAALLDRLDRRLDLRGEELDRPQRQRGLRDTIAWSYALLTTEEQRTFRGLAVFAGEATLSAIAAVACDAEPATDLLDQLVSLVDKGLLQARPADADEPRFRLLETVREFAWEQLSAAEELAIDASGTRASMLR